MARILTGLGLALLLASAGLGVAAQSLPATDSVLKSIWEHGGDVELVVVWPSRPHVCETPTSCPSYVVRTVDLNGYGISSAGGVNVASGLRGASQPVCITVLATLTALPALVPSL